jgi:hypothetical protein
VIRNSSTEKLNASVNGGTPRTLNRAAIAIAEPAVTTTIHTVEVPSQGSPTFRRTPATG